MIERDAGTEALVAGSLTEAVRLLVSQRFDLVVCSDELAPELPFGEVARTLQDASHEAPLLVLGASGGRRSVTLAVESGASGHVALAAVDERLAPAVGSLLEGDMAFPPASAPPTDGPRLTPRELDVIDGYDHGLADKEVAAKLDLSVSTIKSHARSIYAKLGVNSRTQALHKARQTGLI